MARVNARYLLDADVCIYAMTRRSPRVLARFDRLQPGEALVSMVAYGELLFGLSKSRTPDAAGANLALLTSRAAVEPLPVAAARHYAEIRRHLEVAGTPVGGNDLWIAAHARAAGLILVTNNEREFRRVPQLEVENWTQAGVQEPPGTYAKRRRRKVRLPGAAAEATPHDAVADLRSIARGLTNP